MNRIWYSLLIIDDGDIKKVNSRGREVGKHRMLSGPARRVNECKTIETMKRGVDVNRNRTALTRMRW